MMMAQGIVAKPELNGRVVELMENGYENIFRFKCRLFVNSDGTLLSLRHENLVAIPPPPRESEEYRTLLMLSQQFGDRLSGASQFNALGNEKRQCEEALESAISLWPACGHTWSWYSQFSAVTSRSQSMEALFARRSMANSNPETQNMRNTGARFAVVQTLPPGDECTALWLSLHEQYWQVSLANAIVQHLRIKMDRELEENSDLLETAVRNLDDNVSPLLAKARATGLSSILGRNEANELDKASTSSHFILFQIANKIEKQAITQGLADNDRHSVAALALYSEAERILQLSQAYGDRNEATAHSLGIVRARKDPRLLVSDLPNGSVGVTPTHESVTIAVTDGRPMMSVFDPKF